MPAPRACSVRLLNYFISASWTSIRCELEQFVSRSIVMELCEITSCRYCVACCLFLLLCFGALCVLNPVMRSFFWVMLLLFSSLSFSIPPYCSSFVSFRFHISLIVFCLRQGTCIASVRIGSPPDTFASGACFSLRAWTANLMRWLSFLKSFELHSESSFAFLLSSTNELCCYFTWGFNSPGLIKQWEWRIRFAFWD